MLRTEQGAARAERMRRREVTAADDDVLLDWARDGDRSAFAELYRRSRPAVLLYATALCRRHLRSADHADDVVAEATRKVLQAIGNGRGPRSGFRQYLYTATRSVVFSQSRLAGTSPHIDVVEPSVDGPEALIDGWIALDALRQLPPRWQRILWSTEVEGYLPRDLAPELGLTANNVAVLAHRARHKLHRALLQTA